VSTRRRRLDDRGTPAVRDDRRAVPGMSPRIAAHSSSDRPLLADDHARAPAQRVLGERAAVLAGRNDVAPTWQSAVSRPSSSTPRTDPSTRRATVLEEHALHGVLRTEREDLFECGRRRARRQSSRIGLRRCQSTFAQSRRLRRGMPSPRRPAAGAVHRREYFDERRAAKRRARNARLHRPPGKKAISVQSTGMGCPSAAIVIEELVQLGVKRLIRVGTCGGLPA